jgi:hypothetical protein
VKKRALIFSSLVVAVALPAFSQIPAKVALSRAHTPVADGFTVAWTDLTNETAYHLEHATSANFISSTLITNISANATSHNLTSLTPNTTYYVRVRAAAAGGNGTWSNVQTNQLLSLDPGQTRYLSVAGVPHGASHSVNFTVSDVFGSANAAGLADGTTASEASTIILLGSNGSTAHTIFYNSSQNEWREGATNKGSEIVGFGKGFIVKNNSASTDYFLLVGSASREDPGLITVFDAEAPAGRLSLLSTSKFTPTSLAQLGFTFSNNTTTGLKRATAAKDADLLLVLDNAGGLKRYHFDGTNWKSGLRAVSDPSMVTVPAGAAFFLRKASGSSFEQWSAPLDEDADAMAYLNAVEAADGQALEAEVRQAVDKFVKDCKADGIWSAIKASCILAGARTLNGALVPLLGTAPTNVSGNFGSGDYDRETGLKSNGSSKHLDTNRANNADPQDDRHYSVFVHTLQSGGVAGTYIGSVTRNAGSSGVLRSGANPANNQFRLSASSHTNIAGGDVPGFIGASREASGSYIVRNAGTSTTLSITSQTPDSSNMLIFKGLDFNNNGRIQFYSIGEAIDLALLDTRVSTLMTDLANAIP